MKERVVTAFVTILIFGAGFGVGLWAGRQRPLPPPPMHLMDEFGAGRSNSGGAFQREPIDRARLASQIELLGPQIKVYQARIAEIDDDFERDLKGILRPDQQAIRAERLRRRQERMAQADHRPFSDEEIWRLQQPPQRLFRMVVLSRELDEMTQDLKLDEAQRGRVLDLLRQRREKFLSLVDQVPSPSVILSRLASQIQRLEQPKP